jgi:glycoside hydrolase-like protein
MKKLLLPAALALVFGSAGLPYPSAAPKPAPAPRAYLGFDRNDYPGDASLKLLRRSFAYSSYWLNPPPGAKSNTWSGKRRKLDAAGFGFLVLFNGRRYSEIRAAGDAARLGARDAVAAVHAARHEGFARETVIFLDQEEGGRLLPEQRAYLHAWVDGVGAAGFRAGVYCSGMPAREGGGGSVVTAEDILQNAAGRKIVCWVSNDACPPSPGCAFPQQPPAPSASGVAFARVWQFAQSPRRKGPAAGCPANYHPDGNCYPPGVTPQQELHLDLDTATSPDPSHGRQR